MTGAKRSPSTADAPGAPPERGSALLGPLVLAVMSRLDGRAPSTCLSDNPL
ncbi:MAG: hypothetical protein HIU89_18505 [Proteobacteria bacterium]|nr:hypothetical protein [Pseudomonadota bacterium]